MLSLDSAVKLKLCSHERKERMHSRNGDFMRLLFWVLVSKGSQWTNYDRTWLPRSIHLFFYLKWNGQLVLFYFLLVILLRNSFSSLSSHGLLQRSGDLDLGWVGGRKRQAEVGWSYLRSSFRSSRDSFSAVLCFSSSGLVSQPSSTRSYSLTLAQTPSNSLELSQTTHSNSPNSLKLAQTRFNSL